MKKEQTYRGKNITELAKLEQKELLAYMNSREKRVLKRGFTEQQKKLLMKIKKAKDGKFSKLIKTHCRDMIIMPNMVGLTIHIHAGREFVPVTIEEDMIGHYLGEFAMTRKKVQHSAPGIGATKSSAAMSVK
ncbi:MAG TPA: 30S ribosomal protein S19 [Candidatus Nanoarchaeia archaeon]|nr:30S ribosomal protein S19 [Candidatus Nanoarchaeia archaeon]